MASASVWGTDAEHSESVAEFLAKHAAREDMSPAAVAAAEERDAENDVVAGGLRRQQLCRFFKNYSVGGSSIAFRGFADAHGEGAARRSGSCEEFPPHFAPTVFMTDFFPFPAKKTRLI